MNKLAIIAIAALVIATAAASVATAQQSALAGDRDVNQEGKCRNCQQQQAVDNDDSLNTEGGDAEVDDGDGNTVTGGDAFGGQFQERTGGG
jgi:hypothetical protein